MINYTDAKPEYNEMLVIIPGKSYNIPAVLCVPNDISEKHPVSVVVMLHGTGSQKNEVGDGYLRLAHSLSKAGIASVRFDFAGCGDSPVDYSQYTMSGAIADTKSVIDYIKGYSTVSFGKLGIVGWSQGAMLAVIAGAKMKEQISSLVLWAPALKMDFYWSEYRAEALQNGKVTIDPGWRPPLTVSAKWFMEAQQTDAEEYLNQITADVLSIAGSNDDFQFDKNINIITAKAAGKSKKGIIIDGADHTFFINDSAKTMFDQVEYETVRWFEEMRK